MNETERIALVEHICTLYPRLQQFFEHMDQCTQSVTEASQNLTQCPLNMAVAGQAGVGKTVLAQIWLSEAMRKMQVGETRSSSPYHYIRLPAMITQKSLLYHLLCTATDFCSNRQLSVTNTWNMENLFFQVLPASGIHLIILDNCEYLIRNQSMHTTSALIELLVRLIPICVLCGKMKERNKCLDTMWKGMNRINGTSHHTSGLASVSG